MPYSANDIAFMREQIRMVVDPLLMRLRSELYGGDTFGTISPSRLPDGVVTDTGAITDDVIAQLESGGTVLTVFMDFTAGTGGIQEGKAVAHMDDGRVVHADCTQASHAGRIVGIAKHAASENETVQIQQYGILNSTQLNFTQKGAVLPSTNGSLVFTLQSEAAFSQFIGYALDTHKVFITITTDVYIV